MRFSGVALLQWAVAASLHRRQWLRPAQSVSNEVLLRTPALKYEIRSSYNIVFRCVKIVDIPEIRVVYKLYLDLYF